MKSSLVMNFSVDKEKKTINVEREFAAPLPKVWEAWTKSDILDQWWAPKPWKTRTKSMDFREGGKWQYAMVGPNDETHWCMVDYKTIKPQKSFSGLDAFCDVNGNLNTEMPRMNWKVDFNPTGDSTLVHINITFDDLNDLEKIIEMGFKEGFTSAMENLDELYNTNQV